MICPFDQAYLKTPRNALLRFKTLIRLLNVGMSKILTPETFKNAQTTVI